MPDDLTAWIGRLYADPGLTGMGQAQRVDDLNLGLGWIYYGLARLVRPQRVVVIGSYRGFAPLVFSRALADNNEGGRVTFIDPSFVDDFWRDRDNVEAYFAAYGNANVDHFCMTTQEYALNPAYRGLGDVGILLVDGYHSRQQARFDHETFLSNLGRGGYALFHDSVRPMSSGIYGPDKRYTHDVFRYMDDLRRDPQWEVLALPHGAGLCMVRRVGAAEDSTGPWPPAPGCTEPDGR